MIYGYLRLSTSEAKQRNSFNVQQGLVSAKFGVDQFFKDTASGGTAFDKRSGWIELMGIVKRGDKIVTLRMDRLTRDSMHYAVGAHLLHKKGVELLFVDGINGEGNFVPLIRTILGAVAQFEKSMIVDRIKSTKAKQKSDGVYLGGSVPFGYRKRGDKIVQDTKEQKVISKIMQLHKEGVTMVNIAGALNDEGISTKMGKKWSVVLISRLIKKTKEIL